MTWLALSILANSGLLLMFRWFADLGVHTRHAILVNYLVAALTGFFLFPPSQDLFSRPWFWLTAAMGLLFYLVFRIMAKTAQENGVAVSVVVTKMSVIIPVIIGLTVLQESASWVKILGILTGLASVFLTTKGGVRDGAWIWPVILFLSTGLIDTSLKLMQVHLVDSAEFPIFSASIFMFAFISGLAHHLYSRERIINRRSFSGGLALGLINFCSLYFVLKALDLPGLESSVVFPINNFGVVLGATLLAIVLFKEHPRTRVWVGLGLASASIWILYLTT